MGADTTEHERHFAENATSRASREEGSFAEGGKILRGDALPARFVRWAAAESKFGIPIFRQCNIAKVENGVHL